MYAYPHLWLVTWICEPVHLRQSTRLYLLRVNIWCNINSSIQLPSEGSFVESRSKTRIHSHLKDFWLCIVRHNSVDEVLADLVKEDMGSSLSLSLSLVGSHSTKISSDLLRGLSSLLIAYWTKTGKSMTITVFFKLTTRLGL